MGLFDKDWVAFTCGCNFYILQQLFGMRHSEDGVKYYAEVHKSTWNSLIHTIFMPVTMFGFFISVPAIFNAGYKKSHTLRRLVMVFYLGVYIKISSVIGILVFIYYIIPLYYASVLSVKFKRFGVKAEIIIGLFISTLALFIQEILGHYVGGDSASRIEAIPNAIIYAPYYSVAHLFTNLN